MGESNQRFCITVMLVGFQEVLHWWDFLRCVKLFWHEKSQSVFCLACKLGYLAMFSQNYVSLIAVIFRAGTGHFRCNWQNRLQIENTSWKSHVKKWCHYFQIWNLSGNRYRWTCWSSCRSLHLGFWSFLCLNDIQIVLNPFSKQRQWLTNLQTVNLSSSRWDALRLTHEKTCSNYRTKFWTKAFTEEHYKSVATAIKEHGSFPCLSEQGYKW